MSETALLDSRQSLLKELMLLDQHVDVGSNMDAYIATRALLFVRLQAIVGDWSIQERTLLAEALVQGEEVLRHAAGQKQALLQQLSSIKVAQNRQTCASSPPKAIIRRIG